MTAFLSDVDIANRALQHLRCNRISSFTDHTLYAQEMGFAYPRLRDAELRAHLWRFATRRAVMYAVESTTKLWTPPAWAAAQAYAVGIIVTDTAGAWWQSRVASNSAALPSTSSDTYSSWQAYFGPDTLLAHDADETYFAGDLVSSGGQQYVSLVNSNAETPPSAGNWLAVNGTTVSLQILYPLGAGPATDPSTANVFRLPRGFLRQAPTNPKGGTNPFLGAARGNAREDWMFEANYIVSSQPGPIMMRYVADFVDVTQMEPTFCEMLAARLAREVGPRVVQDPGLLPTLLQGARANYRDARREAVSVNAIELGPVDMDLSDYIACRQ